MKFLFFLAFFPIISFANHSVNLCGKTFKINLPKTQKMKKRSKSKNETIYTWRSHDKMSLYQIRSTLRSEAIYSSQKNLLFMHEKVKKIVPKEVHKGPGLFEKINLKKPYYTMLSYLDESLPDGPSLFLVASFYPMTNCMIMLNATSEYSKKEMENLLAIVTNFLNLNKSKFENIIK